MKKKRVIVSCLLVFICMKSLIAYAASGTLNIQVEGKSVLAEVYQVGTKGADGSIRFNEKYGIVSQLSNAQDVKEIIDTFDKCIDDKTDISGISDDEGKILISGLNDGVYYIRFSGGEYKREYVSALIQIPDYYQEIYPKYEEFEESDRLEGVDTGDSDCSKFYLVLCALSCVVLLYTTTQFRKNLGGKND